MNAPLDINYLFMDDFKTRLSLALKNADMKPAGLARRMGVNPQNITHWQNRGGIPGNKLFQAANILNINASWLATGQGNKESLQNVTEFNISESRSPYNSAGIGGEDKRNVPRISWESADKWAESPNEYSPGDAEEWLPRMKKNGPNTVALTVSDDSMTSPIPGKRSYPEGMIIYVDPDQDIINRCRVVAKLGSGDLVFKQYVEDVGKKWLMPLNPAYEKIEIKDDCQIIGKVVWAGWDE